MFKHINSVVASIALYSRMAMSLVMAVNLLNYFLPLHLLQSAGNLNEWEYNKSLVLLFLEAHQDGVLIWGIFFGMHLTALGYLVYQSGHLPKILGVMLVAGSFGYTIESISAFTVPDNIPLSYLSMALLGFAIIGELSFAIWLTIKGKLIWEKTGR